MEKKRVTIKDIAVQTGLSVSTVSFALNGKGRVNSKTREKVILQAREMRYQPNILASTLPMKSKIRIAVVCPANDMYFCMVLQGIEAYYSEIAQYKVELEYYFCHGYDSEDQLKRLKECVAAGVDGILLTPVTTNAIINFTRHIVKQGMPIVTFTNDLSSRERLCFVGQNGVLAGKLAAELMDRMLPPNAKISLFADDTPLIINQQRMDVFSKQMRLSKKNYVLNDMRLFPNDTEETMRLAKETICIDQPDAIYTNNMLGTIALGRAMRLLRPCKKILMFGYDANEEIDEMLRDDILDLTLFQDPFAQGYYALMLLFRNLYYKQKIRQMVYHTRTLVLTKSNVSEREKINSIFLL
ncbi:MAG: LacI family DNA-binding transcriptional regulator [Clostridia bacterium]